MTKKVMTIPPDEPIQKVYSLIVEIGFTAFPVMKNTSWQASYHAAT